MQFTGRNLKRIRDSLQLAVTELLNEISTCPDVYAYAEEIEENVKEIEEIERLIARIDSSGEVPK